MSTLRFIADICAVFEVIFDVILIVVLLFYFGVIRGHLRDLNKRILKLEGESRERFTGKERG